VNYFLATALASFGISLILTPVLRDVFRAFRVVDEPDHRKVHGHPIPRVGGIAIAISYFVVFHFIRNTGESLNDPHLATVFRMLPAGLLVFVTGLVDDLFGLKPKQKFFGQFVAAGLACWAGVKITGVGGYSLPDIWAIPITLLWLVLCTNAFNLVDGLDGLASGVGLFATLTIFIAAILQGNEPLALATLTLAGALLGFLCFNFNPATVFLGDCGSLLIGFLLGCFGVIWAQKSVTLLGIAAPLMALSMPLLDVTLCIIRRWLQNRPIFSADRGHIHHRLLDHGLSPKQAVFVLYGLSSVAAICSLVQAFVNNVYIAVLVGVAFLLIVWVVVHKLRYAEFIMAGRLLRLGELQRGVRANLTLHAFEKSIGKAATPAECWEALLGTIEGFGFIGAEMQMGNERFQQIAKKTNCWFVRIPLSAKGDYLELVREVGSPVLPAVVAPFVDLLATSLSQKLLQQQKAASSNGGEEPQTVPAGI
jgi:UDP-GlcNAc:undecaprenyl-phosphate GlcNAc-1-phosphate transferase